MEREQGKDEFGKGIRWWMKRIHDEFVLRRIRVPLHVFILHHDGSDPRGSEVDFEKLLNSYLHSGSIETGKVDSLWEKLSGQGKGRFARWACALLVEELVKTGKKEKNPWIAQSLFLTARKTLFQGTQATEEFGGIPLDPDCLRDLSSSFLSDNLNLPILKEKLVIFMENPPREAVWSKTI